MITIITLSPLFSVLSFSLCLSLLQLHYSVLTSTGSLVFYAAPLLNAVEIIRMKDSSSLYAPGMLLCSYHTDQSVIDLDNISLSNTHSYIHHITRSRSNEFVLDYLRLIVHTLSSNMSLSSLFSHPQHSWSIYARVCCGFYTVYSPLTQWTYGYRILLVLSLFALSCCYVYCSPPHITWNEQPKNGKTHLTKLRCKKHK